MDGGAHRVSGSLASKASDQLSNDVLFDLLEKSGDGLALIDAGDGTYVHLNAAARATLGTADQLIGTLSPWPVHAGAGQLATQFDGRHFTYRVTELAAAERRLYAVQFNDVTAERRQEEQLRAFSVSAANLAFADTLSTALDRLADQVRRTAGMSSCTFLLYDPDGRVRQSGVSGRYPHHPDYLRRLVESRNQGAPLISDAVMRTRMPEIAQGWHDRMLIDPRFAPMRIFTEKSDWDTIVVVPLLSRGEPVGVMNGFYCKGTEPARDELQFLLGIADQAAVAVDMFALRDRVQREAARQERGKIARDLHDSISQMLFSLNLQAAATASAPHGPDVERSLSQIRSLSSDAFGMMRQIILGTRPIDVEHGVDLRAALAQHISALSEYTDIVVHLHAPDGEMALSADVQEEVFRVVQEALHNVVRHAPGSDVTVRIQPEPARQELHVVIADNGGGFDLAQHRPGHLGVPGMMERIRGIGGTVTINSTGHGTTISVVVPLEALESDTAG